MNPEFVRGDFNIPIQSQSLVANTTGNVSGGSLVDELSGIPGGAKLTDTAKVLSFELEYQKRDAIWRLVEGLNSCLGRGSFWSLNRTRVLSYSLHLGLKVAFRHICPNSLHKSMWPKSHIQSEHLPVRYFEHPSQIFSGPRTLGDRGSVARYRSVSAILSRRNVVEGISASQEICSSQIPSAADLLHV